MTGTINKDKTGVGIDIAVNDSRWDDSVDTLESDISDACLNVYEKAAFKLDAPEGDLRPDIGIVFTDDATIRTLNHDYRGKDVPTNVLSFSNLEGPDDPALLVEGESYHLGDIVLAYETIHREAANADKTLRDHVLHLIIHGFLHLIGYDHDTDARAQEMEDIEVRICDEMHVKNPYLSETFVS